MGKFDTAYPGEALLRLVPLVLRAREFHLYLEGGQRLLDLWRQGGRAVLGHKPPEVLKELKNAAERGLFTPLPHPAEKRFFKALEQFFPGRVFRLFTDESSLRRALEQAGFTGPFYDPAFPTQSAGEPSISLWRPFIKMVPGTVFVPVLPWPLGPVVLVLDKSAEAPFSSPVIPPVLLAPATRALYDLAAALKDHSPDSLKFKYPKIEKALKNGNWRRQGIYITGKATLDNEKYEALFRRFLEAGFLIPLSPAEPIILPLWMSPGEEAKLAGLFNQF